MTWIDLLVCCLIMWIFLPVSIYLCVKLGTLGFLYARYQFGQIPDEVKWQARKQSAKLDK
jgi:hypothetical protein